MTSAFIYASILWLTVHEHRSSIAATDEFYPTPIPLTDWHPYPPRASLQDSAEPPVAVPAHYWEDALRHSVYLTLVRDKIDQLIARDISHEKRPHHRTNDVNDHDLWDKIKSAPFDRIEYEEPSNNEEATFMSKGRLMENDSGYRFAEDDKTKVCNDSDCMDGVRAMWSVKRVRQRDAETTPGPYHYELTFSVVSRAPKRLRKPHENPARTFTVREMSPETIFDEPHEHRTIEDVSIQKARPGRALWVHKNIVPQRHARYYHHGNDRLFTSLFADDDYEVQRRPVVPYAPPPYPQYSKVGYVGQPSDNHHYKKYTPYTYKPSHQQVKYSRPSIPFPVPQPQHHYLDIDAIGVVSAPYVPQPPETRYHMPMKHLKPTHPPVLPTPAHAQPNTKNSTFLPTVLPPKSEATNSTKQAEPVAVHNKPRPNPLKISYFTDTLRPPVYNAPPGVFVTMDKKPFKPLPPLKLHHSTKSSKPYRPTDFRPSPQLLDIQFSEPDPLFNGAFRPMAINYASSNATVETEIKVAESSETTEHIVQKHNITEDKAVKRNKKKSQRVTTTTTMVPIASETSNNDFDISWGNLLGAFAKTTPIDPQAVKFRLPEYITPVTTTTTTTTEAPTTTEEVREVQSTTTMASTTSKRTRPPPKFKSKQKLNVTNKIRKHKRVTTTTLQPPVLELEKAKRVVNDLTPQASSAASSGTRSTPRWVPSSTTTTTTTPRSTTTTVSTTYESKTTAETQTVKPLKNENRYRQTTLMQKGTSVNHDKWSIHNNADKGTSAKTVIPPTGHFPPRRVESNFHGYTVTKPSTTQATYFDETDEDDYDDFDLTTTTQQQKIKNIDEPIAHDKVHIDSSDESNNESDNKYFDHDEYNESDEDEVITLSPFLFYSKSTTPLNSKSTEAENVIAPTQTTVVSSDPTSAPKKKCKKKKANSTTSTFTETQEDITSPASTTNTLESTKPDILDELFKSFTSDEATNSSITSNTDSSADNVPAESVDDFMKSDFFDFLSLPNFKTGEKKTNASDDDDDEYNDDINVDNEDFDDDDGDAEESYIGSSTNEEKFDDDEDDPPRESINAETTDHARPYSIFELMAMD